MTRNSPAADCDRAADREGANRAADSPKGAVASRDARVAHGILLSEVCPGTLGQRNHRRARAREHLVSLVAVAELKDRSPTIAQHDVRTSYPGALMVIRRPPASFPMMAVTLPVTVIE